MEPILIYRTMYKISVHAVAEWVAAYSRVGFLTIGGAENREKYWQDLEASAQLET